MARIDQILTSWKNGKAAPVYVLYGKEEFLRSELLHAAAELLVPDEATRSFNYDLLYGAETQMGQVITMAMGYPMMADRRLVIVRDAKRLMRSKAEGVAPAKGKKGGSEDPLLRYLEQPNPECVLIFDMEEFGARNTQPFKDLAAKAEVIEFAEMREGEVIDWLKGRAKTLGRKLGTEAARLMVGHLGISLRDHANELEKLSTFTNGRAEITTSDIEQVVGASREYNIFELTKAIEQGAKAQALTILLRMIEARTMDPAGILVMLGRSVERLIVARDMAAARASESEIAEALEMRGGAAYYVKDVIAAARRYSRERLDQAMRAVVEAEARTRGPHVSTELILEALILRLVPNGT